MGTPLGFQNITAGIPMAFRKISTGILENYPTRIGRMYAPAAEGGVGNGKLKHVLADPSVTEKKCSRCLICIAYSIASSTLLCFALLFSLCLLHYLLAFVGVAWPW